MILAASMLAVLGAPVTPPALVEAFRTMCMRNQTPLAGLDQVALAAGFHSVPADSANHENLAWERDGVRLIAFAAQTNPSWPLPPTCGVSGDLGGWRDDDTLVTPLSEMSGVGFVETVGGSHYNIPTSKRRLIQMFVNREARDHVGATILIDAPDP